MGLGQRKGGLRAGYDADLFLVDGDPLEDIGALRHVTAVMSQRRWSTVQATPADQRPTRPL